MKTLFMYLWVLLVFVFSCENELDQKILSEEDNLVSKAGKAPPLSNYDFNIPPDLVTLCLEYEQCDNLERWVKNMNKVLENACQRSDDCSEKMILVNALLWIQRQLDVLGIDEVECMNALCDGFLDETNTYVQLTPDKLDLNIGETKNIQAEIMVGNETCSGEIKWGCIPQGIVEVDDAGNVKGIKEGQASVVAFVKGAENIIGFADVNVESKISRIVLSPTELSIWVSAQYTIKALLFDNSGNQIPLGSNVIAWTADNNIIDITTINDGSQIIATGLSSGVSVITASVEDIEGICQINVYSRCPDPPELPDCSERIELPDEKIVVAGTLFGSGPMGSFDLDMDPEDEAYLSLGVELGCCDACVDIIDPTQVCHCVPPAEHCPLIDYWCRNLGGYMTWRFVDQNGSQIVADSRVGGGYSTEVMWVRGSAGPCGHPTKFEMIANGFANCGHGTITKYKRPGWNKAGWDLNSAADIGVESGFCGNINETPCGQNLTICDNTGTICSLDPTWSVNLGPLDELNIKLRLFTKHVQGAVVDLYLLDEAGVKIKTLLSFYYFGTEKVLQLSQKNETGIQQKFYIVLNARGAGGPNSRGNNVWEYNVGFNVQKAGCLSILPEPICPPEDPNCNL